MYTTTWLINSSILHLHHGIYNVFPAHLPSLLLSSFPKTDSSSFWLGTWVSKECLNKCIICTIHLSLEEVAVCAGHEVMIEVDYNSLLTDDDPQRIWTWLDMQLLHSWSLWCLYACLNVHSQESRGHVDVCGLFKFIHFKSESLEKRKKSFEDWIIIKVVKVRGKEWIPKFDI